jgi:hypothetical protein
VDSHTPGPWKTEFIGGTIRAVDKKGNDVGLIADAHDEISKYNLREAVENHNLVPELLAALKSIAKREWVTKIDDKEQLTKWIAEFVYIAKQAVQKAEAADAHD